MRVNSLFLRYIKFSALITLIIIVISTLYIFANLDQTEVGIEETFKFLENKGNSIAEKNYHYGYFDGPNGEKIPDIQRFWEYRFMDISGFVMEFTILALVAYVFLTYNDVKTKKVSSFINHLPISREKIFIYRLSAGALMLFIIFFVTILLTFLIFKRHEPDINLLYQKCSSFDFSNKYTGSFFLNLLKENSLPFTLTLLFYSVFDLCQNIFGRKQFAVIAIAAFIPAIIMLDRGISVFVYDYSLTNTYYYGLINFIQMILETDFRMFITAVILMIISFVLNINSKNERCEKVFIYDCMKYPFYAVSFFCSAFFVYWFSRRMSLINNLPFISCIILLAFSGTIGLFIIRKFINYFD